MRRLLSAFFCLIVLTATSTAVTVNNPMPYYFSGTNCRAMGSLGSPTVEGWPTIMNLYVGGELVAHWDSFEGMEGPAFMQSKFGGGGPKYPSIPRGLRAMFDSTHFAPGSTVAVFFEAWTNLGYFSATGSAVVKNSILLSQHPEPLIDPDTALVVGDLIQPNFHRDLSLYRNGWSPFDFIYGMAERTVIFSSTHGTNTEFYAGKKFYDADGDPWITTLRPNGGITSHAPTHPDWLYSVGIGPYRAAQMGTGYPPFNSSGQPPINLAFILSCSTGAEDEFIEFLRPYINYYAGALEDQAFTGFAGSLFAIDHYDIARAAFASLTAGKTVLDAKIAVLALGKLCGEDNHVMTSGDMPIYGDPYTRLHSVYTASLAPPVGWFRLY
jgi:hypothetical protein